MPPSVGGHTVGLTTTSKCPFHLFISETGCNLPLQRVGDLTAVWYPITGHLTLAPSKPEAIMTRTSHTLSPNRPQPILTRSASYREPSLSNLKRASAEVEVITPSSPLGNPDNMMTFSSSTLPRYSLQNREDVNKWGYHVNTPTTCL